MKIDLNAQQIQAAAKAGLELLSDQELRVSMRLAVSGQLNILATILQSVMEGGLVLTSPPQLSEVVSSPDKRDLKSVVKDA